MQDTHVGRAHGNGGRFMRELIEEVFLKHLGSPVLDAEADAALLPLGDGEVACHVAQSGAKVQAFS